MVLHVCPVCSHPQGFTVKSTSNYDLCEYELTNTKHNRLKRWLKLITGNRTRIHNLLLENK